MGLLADNYGVGGGFTVIGLIHAILFPLVAVGRLWQKAWNDVIKRNYNIPDLPA
jgi:hypothetical protein